MGRTARHRRWKCQLRSTFPIKLEATPEVIRLKELLLKPPKFSSYEKSRVEVELRKITPALFPVFDVDPENVVGTGEPIHGGNSRYRGICSLEKFTKGEVILRLPCVSLITSQHLPPGIQAQKTSLQNKLSVFLYLESSNRSSYLRPYLDTLPESFQEHPQNLPPDAFKYLPWFAQDLLFQQRELVLKGFQELKTILPEEELEFDRFKYFWLCVYTRSVYYPEDSSTAADIELSCETKGESDQMALAPFLDLFNHSPTPNTVTILEAGSYVIRASEDITKFEQIFISYGNHPNFRLWTDYGFVPVTANPFNYIPVKLNKLADVLVKDLERDRFESLFSTLLKDQRKVQCIQKFGLGKELSIEEEDLSPNLSLLLAMELWDPGRGTFDFHVNSQDYKYSRMVSLLVGSVLKDFTDYLAGLNQFTEFEGQETKNLNCSAAAAKSFIKNSIVFLERHLSALGFIPCRFCFHPGVSSLATEDIQVPGGTKEVKSSQMLKAMVTHIWPKDEPEVRKRVLTAVGLLVGSKVLNVGVPFLFKIGVDSMSTAAPLSGTVDTITNFTFAILLGYGIARAGAAGFNELRNAVFAQVAQRSIRKIAQNVFLHLHNLDLSFHLNRQTGALSKTIDRGSRGINFVLTAMVFNILPTAFELSLVSAVLGYKYGTDFALVALGCVSTYALYTLSVTQWRTKFRVAMNKAENESGNRAVDSLLNYETVKYFNNEAYEARRYDQILQIYEKASLKTNTSLAALNFGQNAIFSIALSTIMIMAAKEIAQGNMTVGDLVMVNGLLFQMSIPLGFLGSVYREIRQAMIDMATMFALMAVPPKIQEDPKLPFLHLSPPQASIEFKDVRFSYVDNTDILNGLNLKVEPGKKVALVGGSGCGKSTIIRLLYRFYQPHTGEILIGGSRIDQVNLASLRKTIAVVPQDCVLFHDTILHNLHYGNLDAPLEDVYAAAELANLHKTILRWPKGYQTQVGERGLKLSGGEKQRVAIARAVLKASPILVFDEATSSLDSITEQTILDSLKKASAGRTSIWIAHRLSTVLDADEIHVLDNGRIVDQGTHEELLNRNSPLYSSLWNSQNIKSKFGSGDSHNNRNVS
ncbi:unnamed protein product [Allacma fusca]|uniref:Iron-sulfur clusters transporter ABCB7, mitochondrial n=1 Tax=Allacma fusca TaxID=39272 RepID=A0A8J2JKA5_9HEXA|nr:unnamed protein product [Allacma fusca]